VPKARFEAALAAGGAKVAKIVRRIRQAGVYFVTTDTWERHATFVNNELAKIVVEQIVSCRDRGFYNLHAFVLMPEHLHILLTPSEETSIERTMQMIKGGSSHRIGIEKPQAFPVWHRSFHDRWIRDAQQFWRAKSYIEQNPVKAGLAERADEYAWSSANGKIVLDHSRYEQPAAKAFGHAH
jgi:REP-associated tyrosine transposase